MVSMRRQVGLVLGIGLVAAFAPPAAYANTYCAGEVPHFYGCTASSPTIQGALDAAGSNPGYDLVRIVDGRHVLAAGLVYSDHAQPDNEVWIGSGAGNCVKALCAPVTLAGGAPGATLLSFGGGGGAKVTVEGLSFEPPAGVTAVMLPPGGKAGVQVRGEDGSIGIRSEGTAGRPAIIALAQITQPLGGAPDIAIDAAGAARVDLAYITSDIAARSRMSDGLLDIRESRIQARTGVTGQHARITRSLLDLRGASGPSVGIEAVCPSADTPDADVSALNVTVIAGGNTESTGARALARGGDGDSCDATARLNSTILHGVATSLDAIGEAGTGTDPRDGTARFEMAYSNFDPGAVAQSGPTRVETASPGGNVYGAPGFNPLAPDAGGPGPGLAWDSPLVDGGDPAPSDTDDLSLFKIVNGRRDIGVREYQFAAPHVGIVLAPFLPIRPGKRVRLGAGATDFDGDPLHVKWEFSDGTASEYEEPGNIPIPYFTRRYPRPGTYVERVTATDPTGRTGTAQTVVVVRRQRMLKLSIVPRRLRAPRRETTLGRTVITFRTSILDESVHFRVERGVPRRGSRGIRWVRTRHRFEATANTRLNERPFNGWIDGRRLRPGRYRLVGAPRGVRPLRARFRMVPNR
jgi:hypothetical protein